MSYPLELVLPHILWTKLTPLAQAILTIWPRPQ